MAFILVVDDDPDILDLCRATLELRGHDVVTERTARAALELLWSSSIHLVILDLVLPGMDGFEALRALRSRPSSRDVPVLVLSAIPDTQARVRALRLGADDYLVKPFAEDELAARVDRALERLDSRGLRGEAAAYSLAELLQGLEHAQRSGRLWVSSAEREGLISIRKGRIVDARSGRLRGLEACLELLDMADCRFRLANEPVEDTTISVAITDLLMQDSWLRDEIGWKLELQQELGREFAAQAKGPASVDDEVQRRLLDRIRALPGVTAAELVAMEVASRPRVLHALAVLQEGGHVTGFGEGRT